MQKKNTAARKCPFHAAAVRADYEPDDAVSIARRRRAKKRQKRSASMQGTGDGLMNVSSTLIRYATPPPALASGGGIVQCHLQSAGAAGRSEFGGEAGERSHTKRWSGARKASPFVRWRRMPCQANNSTRPRTACETLPPREKAEYVVGVA